MVAEERGPMPWLEVAPLLLFVGGGGIGWATGSWRGVRWTTGLFVVALVIGVIAAATDDREPDAYVSDGILLVAAVLYLGAPPVLGLVLGVIAARWPGRQRGG